MAVIKQDEFGMVGLGLRREMLDELLTQMPSQIDFMEVAPENWLKLGVVSLNNLTHSLMLIISTVMAYRYPSALPNR